MNHNYIVVLCTVPQKDDARRIAQTLVNEKMAACCNIVPAIESYYFWKDEVQRDDELLLIIKSTEQIFNLLEARILELHPYDIPEIIALPIAHGETNYLKWVSENVQL